MLETAGRAMGDVIAFGIMCKAPLEGASKTRLCPPLTSREAAELSRCFIADVASVIADMPAGCTSHGIAIYTPAGREAAFKYLLPPGFVILAQRGGDLGERLSNATEDLIAKGYFGVCLIDSDSPTLPRSLLTQAAEELRRSGDRLVLGPATDGGYYLIGLKQAHAPLFRGVAWSTNQVLTQTLTRAAELRLPVTLLPPWYDVDDLGSLQLLLHELFGNGVPLASDGLIGSPASRSREYLQKLLRTANASRLGFVDGFPAL
jgi:rSAM/selenodomain-associated transferase 1